MQHTIESLKLNVKDACNGKPWLILPQEYRTKPLARAYPLPSKVEEIQLIAAIPLVSRMDCGAVYIRRAISELNRRIKQSKFASERADRKVDAVEQQAVELKGEFEGRLARLEAEAQAVVQRLQDRADLAIASLDELFRLGREGIEGQMRSHLAGEKWMGEDITGRAFRECFRMVTQTIKGLGLPTGEEQPARKAIIEEAAASLRATQEAVAMRGEPEGKPS